MTILLLVAPLAAQERVTRPIDIGLFSPEIVSDPKDGSVRLAHSVLAADEMGATDYKQTESLSERVWARKTFVLESADVTQAELFLYGGAKQIAVNGTTVGSMPLASTGWSRAKVPTSALKAGENEVVLSGRGTLLIEPGRPGRSFKSIDGGQTWASQNLGGKENLQGEYLVRLRLGRYAPHGSAMTPVFDLWATRPSEVSTPGKLGAFQAPTGIRGAQPDGTKVVASLRTGTTPLPDIKTWSNWLPLDKEYRPLKETSGQRWAQLRFEFFTSRPQVTPRLPARCEITYDFLADLPASTEKLLVEAASTAAPISGWAVPFIYQEPTARLKLLRERYQLDQVIAGSKTEMEQLMLLRHWVRNQWHTAWGSHPASWMPPWDTLMILESKDQPDCLTMCTHYGTVMTQCALALGWNARHCILDHHCASEVYVNQHAKWVMMDAGNSKERPDANLHFERNGIPLSALELHQAQRSGKTEGITVHFTPARLMAQIADRCRPAPSSPPRPPLPKGGKGEVRPDFIPVAELPKYPVCGLENYRRYGFPARNNYLSSLVPGEHYQGWSHYFYDGYCWVGDSPDDPVVSPEYSRHLWPGRPQDIDWSLNTTRLHLARTVKPGELRIDLETLTPNLARLERFDGAWKPTPASFTWKLEPGKNALRVRSVNLFDRPGVEASVQVNRKE